MKQIKWLSIITVLVLVLALAACGQGTEDGIAGEQRKSVV